MVSLSYFLQADSTFQTLRDMKDLAEKWQRVSPCIRVSSKHWVKTSIASSKCRWLFRFYPGQKLSTVKTCIMVICRDVRVQILIWFQTFLLFTKSKFQTFNALKSTSFLQAFQINSDLRLFLTDALTPMYMISNSQLQNITLRTCRTVVTFILHGLHVCPINLIYENLCKH